MIIEGMLRCRFLRRMISNVDVLLDNFKYISLKKKEEKNHIVFFCGNIKYKELSKELRVNYSYDHH